MTEWLITLINHPEVRMSLDFLLAAILGGLIGIEREYIKRAAGVRTYALVSLGAAIFTAIDMWLFNILKGPGGTNEGINPGRITAQIVVGIGFLGAGVIILRRGKIEGITTAAGLWVAAAIGMAVGYQLYIAAILSSLITVIIMAVVRSLNIESWLEKELGPPVLSQKEEKEESDNS